ncbi:UDP-N-acetylglucosamine 1-carboxyvinyltransferase [Thermoflavimicrobium daqui]|uniref:UDP-N-acetylglucosamine 1-carboxyvinyltransferase n=1 Tax=Thermoflavimicrobium daqui TaxID=2137476 RepID=A0A364K6L6_9BACL|nr:UDP-N-acetylglucosamine 1-carboxyvinyltransferase [Thermoflavimicrobium daqui]RAL25945.1 UDP-N-acetylglucosamine 1-carboxyvinyltransferase [Thermoflavimicrobium daqui]
MDKITVQGGTRLKGTVKVDGSKNSVLPLIAASILATRNKTVIDNVPSSLVDVIIITQLLKKLGIDANLSNDQVVIDAEDFDLTEASYDLVSKMRASVTVLGPLLARKKHARVALPGGCKIGNRPIDQHLKGLEALGAQFNIQNGYVEGYVPKKLRGSNVYLDIPSVGATQNIMMAATLAEGATTIVNAACEPEIIDLAIFLKSMGAKIEGAGTPFIQIYGVDILHGTEYTVIPDRIEAGTYMIAAAITRGEVFVEGAKSEHLTSLIVKLREMGVQLLESAKGIHVSAKDDLKPTTVKTLPYPGFPTDLQAQMMALQLSISGNSLLTETVFENRFMHVEEFRRMGASVKVTGQTALIEGGKPLMGTEVEATDLRAGAAMILAGLVASGTTTITGLHHIDRGYVELVEKFRSLGAKIERVPLKNSIVSQSSLS